MEIIPKLIGIVVVSLAIYAVLAKKNILSNRATIYLVFFYGIYLFTLSLLLAYYLYISNTEPSNFSRPLLVTLFNGPWETSYDNLSNWSKSICCGVGTTVLVVNLIIAAICILTSGVLRKKYLKKNKS